MFLRNLFAPTIENGFEPYATGKFAIVGYTLLLFLINNFGVLVWGPSNLKVSASSISPTNLVLLTNSERENYGIEKLKVNSKLTSAAYAKANDMIKKDYWNHYGPNGETPWQFFKGAEYSYVYAGENLAKGFVTSEGIHQAWMGSPTHRANILNSKYEDIGIAVVTGTLQGEETVLVVQMFGSLNRSNGEDTPIKQPDKQTTNKPQEQGDIKSISIESPLENSVITDPQSKIEGTVQFTNSSKEGLYRLTIEEDGSPVLSTEEGKSKWSAEKETDWSQGKHTITATAQTGNKKVEDKVTFTLDSTAPHFKKETLSLQIEGDEYRLTTFVDESNSNLVLTVGDKSFPLTVDEAGYHTTTIRKSFIDDKSVITLTLSDKYGNTVTEEIGREVRSAIDELKNKPFILSTWNALTNQAKVNLFFAFFMLVVFAYQFILYRRANLLHTKSKYLFSFGFWCFLISILALSEFGGDLV